MTLRPTASRMPESARPASAAPASARRPLAPWSRPAAAIRVTTALSAAVVLVATVALSGPARAAAAAAEARVAGERKAAGLAGELSNLESRLERLAAEFATPVAETLSHPFEQRLIDAHVFFSQGLYAKASVLLTDIVENPRYASARDLPAALFLLGQALFLDRNYQTAERVFTRLVDPPDPKYHEEALAHLVEIALRTGDTPRMERWFSRISALPGSRPDTHYVIGKALFHAAEPGDDRQLTRALASFARIPADTPRFLQAQYYAGAIHIAQGRPEQARQAFQDIVSGADLHAGTDPHLVELAHIALGRLYAEQGDSARAVDQYQFVPVDSPSYETALFEMAVAYLNAGNLRQAKNTLDILMLSVTDDRIEADAQVLRGRIDILLGEYAEAGEVYDGILDRFARVRAELGDFMGRRDGLDTFFRWMMRSGEDTLGLSQPLSDRVTRWVAAGDTITDVRSVMDDLSRTRSDLADSRQMAARLRAALAAPNRVELFANLRDGWTRTLEVENQLVRLNQEALDLRLSRLDLRRCGEVAGALEEADAKRRELEEGFRHVPQTAIAHRQRVDRVHGRYADLKRQAFLVETSIRLLAKQMDAIDSWLKRTTYEDPAARPEAGRQREILARVAEERRLLEALKQDLDETVAALEAAEGRVGSGDHADQSEAGLKQRLLESHRQVQRLVQSCEERGGGGQPSLEEVHARVWRALDGAARLEKAIAASADRKASEVQRIVEAELRDLDRHEEGLAAAEQRALVVARSLGEQVFREAEARLSDVVLEADLGLVDLAWQRRQEVADEMRALQEQHAAEVQRLERVRGAVLGDAAPASDPSAAVRSIPGGTP